MSIMQRIAISTLLFFSHITFTAIKQKHVIMLDPAGDAKQTGRPIEDSLERALTIKLAEALKTELEHLAPCTVIITRSPGEIVYPLQNANFCNRLPIDLYLSLHFYHTPQEKLSISLYQFSYGTMQIKKSCDLAMIPYDKAYLDSIEQTQIYANHIKTVLTTTSKPLFLINGVYALPFYPLIGIQAPAMAIEMNLVQQTDWQTYLTPLAKSIISALETS